MKVFDFYDWVVIFREIWCKNLLEYKVIWGFEGCSDFGIFYVGEGWFFGRGLLCFWYFFGVFDGWVDVCGVFDFDW